MLVAFVTFGSLPAAVGAGDGFFAAPTERVGAKGGGAGGIDGGGALALESPQAIAKPARKVIKEKTAFVFRMVLTSITALSLLPKNDQAPCCHRRLKRLLLRSKFRGHREAKFRRSSGKPIDNGTGCLILSYGYF